MIKIKQKQTACAVCSRSHRHTNTLTADRSDDLNSKVTSEFTLKLVTEKFMARKEIGLTDSNVIKMSKPVVSLSLSLEHIRMLCIERSRRIFCWMFRLPNELCGSAKYAKSTESLIFKGIETVCSFFLHFHIRNETSKSSLTRFSPFEMHKILVFINFQLLRAECLTMQLND